MKRLYIALALILSLAVPAFAVDFTFHGDFNHRFRLYTNQATYFDGSDKAELLHKAQGKLIADDTNDDLMGEFKYRLWATASSDSGAIKGTYALEIGGVQFGQSGKGGQFSGDGVNVETRWAFIDFALGPGRARMGLMPVKINKFFWVETATGIDYKVPAGPGDLTLGWYRGYEVVSTETDHNDFEDLDAFYARYNFKPADSTTLGLFGVWEHSSGLSTDDGVSFNDIQKYYVKAFSLTDPARNKTIPADISLFTLGLDGNWKHGDFFAKWDLMYQFGDFMDDYDFGGYFGHLDVGMRIGKGKLTYTFWYASGDDDSNDDDLDAFVSTDVDISSEYSVVLFENLTDDDYFSASPYIQDKGLILNRLGYEYQATDKLKLGVAALYLMTAEDIEYDVGGHHYSDDQIGFEVDARVTYKLFSNTEVAIEGGYLATGDAMDYYEIDSDGSADEDIYIICARVRYKF